MPPLESQGIVGQSNAPYAGEPLPGGAIGLNTIQESRPSNRGKIREINITELDRGFIVRVGCQTLAIETRAELVSKLTAYIYEPLFTEQQYSAGTLFK